MVTKQRGAGEGTIRQRTDGRWEARVVWWSDGRRHRRSIYAKTRQGVQAELRKIQRTLDDGLPVVDLRQTVAEYLEWWLRDVLPGTVSVRTEVDYAGHVRRNIIPAIGKVSLAKLRPEHVTTMLRGMERRGLSPRSIQYARAVLRRALRYAEKTGTVARNVASLTDPPKAPAPKLDDIPSAEEARRLVVAAEPDRLGALLHVLLGNGLRPSEACALRWECLDLDGRTLTVKGTRGRVHGRGMIEATPKSARSRRIVPLGDLGVSALREHRRRQLEERLRAGPAWHESEYVFTTPFGRPMEPSDVYRWFRKLCTVAEVAPRRVYSLRHAAALLPIEAGARLEAISDILGHASHSFTKDRYVGHVNELQRQAVTAMDEVLRGGQRGGQTARGSRVSDRESGSDQR